MSDLKPCPFCGSTHVVVGRFGPAEAAGSYYAQCGDCCCSTPYHPTEAEATAAWNTRAADGHDKLELAIKTVQDHCGDAFSDMEGQDEEGFIEAERSYVLLCVTLQRLANALKMEIDCPGAGTFKPKEESNG